MARIFVIEDDAAIRGELSLLLKNQGHEVICCTTFESAIAEVLSAAPDVVLLDLTLPGTDGQFICRELRQASNVPIIVLTSRTTELDEVMSMTMGADDFIAKPYHARILLAHIDAVLRRSSKAHVVDILEYNGVKLDISRSVAEHAGSSVELTKNEMRILAALMRCPGAIVSREDLMRDLWESEAFVDDNTLSVNVNRLRAALKSIGVENYLTTYRGRGYAI